MNDTGGSVVEQLRSARVSRDFFRLFGAGVALGRTFTPDEDLLSGRRAVVLSHRFWTTRFEGRADAVGQAVSLGGEPHTIVGVLREFDFREFGRK